MGMDELEDDKSADEGNNKPSQGAAPSQPEQEEERGARVDAAKAFFRAMYAGEEAPATASGFGQSAPPETSTTTACRNCEGMEHSIRELELKTNEAEQLYKRMAADFDNYRRRMERDREESMALGVKKAAETMMPALDDLDRAMQYLSPDIPPEKVLESFRLVAARILQCMEQVGLKTIEAVGQPFDPKFHEPVQQVETSEHPDGVVMQELRRGYTLGDRVVRPSLVNVASNSSGTVNPAAAAEQALDSTLLDRNALSDLQPAETAGGAEDTNERVFDLGDVADDQEKV